MDALDRFAEERLRATCRQVFASVGEMVRRQMLDLSPSPSDIAPGTESS